MTNETQTDQVTKQPQSTAQLLITALTKPKAIIAFGVAGALIRLPEVIDSAGWFILRVFQGR
jgi:hypothetical protein